VDQVKAVVITGSDGVAAGVREDRSGPAAARVLGDAGFAVENRVVPDGISSVEHALRDAVASGASLVVTTGGTGFSRRDLTPEGTRRVIERHPAWPRRCGPPRSGRIPTACSLEACAG